MIGRDDELLRKLAAALFANPRGTTKDLAEAAGISRATFNRFCGSREHLMEMITQQAEDSLHEIIRIAKQPAKDYNDALNRLLEAHFQNQEYLVFSCSAQHSLDSPYWADYLSSLDTFFLNGQKAGVFRLEYPNQMLTELFVAMICGMIDAEYRGRIAPAGIEAKMLAFFLNGISEK